MYSQSAMYNVMILFLELIGTVAFAASGAMIGLKKKMDILGICVLGCVTAVGGGVIRDVILGLTPPKTFSHPIYIGVAILTSVICFIPAVQRALKEKELLNSRLLLFMDAVGLGIFTVMGIQTAQQHSSSNSWFLLIFVGVVTGVGGGVLRDTLAGERPYIFVKHFYATASLIGAVLCTLLWDHIDSTANMVICVLVIVVLRMLAASFRWKLPAAK